MVTAEIGLIDEDISVKMFVSLAKRNQLAAAKITVPGDSIHSPPVIRISGDRAALRKLLEKHYYQRPIDNDTFDAHLIIWD